MNDKIKEILKEIECYRNEELCLIFLSREESNALLDYITSLQQENDNMEKIIKQNKYKKRILELEEGCSFLQQENERLKKNKIRPDELVSLLNQELKKQRDDYKSRCEKASNKLKRDYYINYNEHNDNVIDEALNILQSEGEK